MIIGFSFSEIRGELAWVSCLALCAAMRTSLNREGTFLSASSKMSVLPAVEKSSVSRNDIGIGVVEI